MFHFTQVVACGFLSKPASPRTTKEGELVAEFDIAVKVGKSNRAYFFTVTAFAHAARMALALKKGDCVIIKGELTMDKWGKGDKKKTKVKIRAESIGLNDYQEEKARIEEQQNADPVIYVPDIEGL